MSPPHAASTRGAQCGFGGVPECHRTPLCHRATNLRASLPLPEYCGASGRLNLATHLRGQRGRSWLCPRLRVTYGECGTGDLGIRGFRDLEIQGFIDLGIQGFEDPGFGGHPGSPCPMFTSLPNPAPSCASSGEEFRDQKPDGGSGRHHQRPDPRSAGTAGYGGQSGGPPIPTPCPAPP